MSNMSYCRFKNTLRDLQECYVHFDEKDKKSNDNPVPGNIYRPNDANVKDFSKSGLVTRM